MKRKTTKLKRKKESADSDVDDKEKKTEATEVEEPEEPKKESVSLREAFGRSISSVKTQTDSENTLKEAIRKTLY